MAPKLVRCTCDREWNGGRGCMAVCPTCERAELHRLLVRRGLVADRPVVAAAYDVLADAYLDDRDADDRARQAADEHRLSLTGWPGIEAKGLVVGDIARLEPGWRNVIDVWRDLGFVHVVASDCTGLFLDDESVEIARRPRPPKLAVVVPPRPLSDRKAAHARDEDCQHQHCIGCWRAGRRTHPVLGAVRP